MLREKVTKGLMIEAHRLIDCEAKSFLAAVQRGPVSPLTYPPDADLSADELAALKGLAWSETAVAALRKCFVSAAGGILFHLFCSVDGTGAPEYWDRDSEHWPGVRLGEGDDPQAPLYHDSFYETWAEYERLRPPLNSASPADGARIIWVIKKREGTATVHLGVSTSDESFWRYSYSTGIQPAGDEDAPRLEQVVRTWNATGRPLGRFK